MPVPRPRRRVGTPRMLAARRLAKRLGVGERELIDAAASLVALAVVAAAFVVPAAWWWAPTTPLVRWPIEAAVAWTLRMAGVWPARVVFICVAFAATVLIKVVNLWAMNAFR